MRLAGVVRKDEWGRGSGVPSERQLAPPELQLLPALKALPSLASMACNLASIAMGVKPVRRCRCTCGFDGFDGCKRRDWVRWWDCNTPGPRRGLLGGQGLGQPSKVARRFVRMAARDTANGRAMVVRRGLHSVSLFFIFSCYA